MASVAARRGQLELAARLTGAATTDTTPQAVSERIVWSRLLKDVIAPAKARSGAEAWRRAEEEGASLTHDELIRADATRANLSRGSHGRSASAPPREPPQTR